MRPLVLSHTGALGGSTQTILGLLRNRPPGVEPICLFLDDGPTPAAARELGVDARVLDAGRARDLRRLVAVSHELTRVIRRRRVDVVFSHASKAQVYASPAATIAGVPNLWYQHEVPGLSRSAPGMTRALQEVAGRLPTRAVICSSDFVARLHAQRWARAPVHRIHPGVRANGVRPHEHATADEPRIAVVGRLQRWKRVDLALEAMRHVVAEQPRARLRIVGAARADVDADYPAELRARAAALGIAHAVDFAGDVHDVDAQLEGADVVLHVSDREAFGVIVVEALLRAIPVVAAPVGGAAEAIRDGVDGLVVDPADSRRLGGALVALGRDPGRRAAMGAAGRAQALERFDERRSAAETWRLVERAAVSRKHKLARTRGCGADHG